MVRAHLGAHSAADANRLIHNSDSVYNRNRAILAGVHAVSKSETAELAAPLAVIEHLACRTGLFALIIHAVLGSIAVARTVDNRVLRFDLFGYDTHRSADCRRSPCTARDTKVGLCAAVCDRFRIVIASGVSARTAVCARKLCADRIKQLIGGDCHHLCGNHEDHRADKADPANNYDW